MKHLITKIGACFMLLVLALSASLSGCFLDPAENLYAIPKQPEEYYELQKAIEEARKRGAVGELVPEVRVNRTMVRDEQSGRNLPIGTVVEAEITQRA